MKLSERPDDETKKKLNNVRKRRRRRKNPINKSEVLSRKDLADLMGTNRDRYERRGGAMRRK